MNYIPSSEAERQAMLAAVGVGSLDDLFDVVPQHVRFPELNLPPALSEMEVAQKVGALGERNADLAHHPCFLGAGAYRHYVPSAVGHLVGRSEFYTAYTPYQPEISQGTLQSIYEFQSMVGELLGLDVANASMYDGASAAAEAAIMAINITRRKKIIVPRSLHPDSRAVIRTYLHPQGVEIIEVETAADAADAAIAAGTDEEGGAACIVVQQPNFFGLLEDVAALGDKIHSVKGLLVVQAYPTALGLLKSPGACGADIAVGEGQSLGSKLSFGGPYVGLFACRTEYVRNLPGRIVGETTDKAGKRGYVLTLQTREQHIRREKATSNICTNTALVALTATIYMSLMGKKGLREVAELSYQKAHYAAAEIAKLDGYTLKHGDAPFFNEFVVDVSRKGGAQAVEDALLAEGIIGGYRLARAYSDEKYADSMLFCCTETNTKAEIDRLMKALERVER